MPSLKVADISTGQQPPRLRVHVPPAAPAPGPAEVPAAPPIPTNSPLSARDHGNRGWRRFPPCGRPARRSVRRRRPSPSRLPRSPNVSSGRPALARPAQYIGARHHRAERGHLRPPPDSFCAVRRRAKNLTASATGIAAGNVSTGLRHDVAHPHHVERIHAIFAGEMQARAARCARSGWSGASPAR